MPKPVSKLTSCYVPLTSNNKKLKPTRSSRGGDRNSNNNNASSLLRPLKVQTLPDNTIYLECGGDTKVLCQVQIPVPNHLLPQDVLPLPVDQGVLLTMVKYGNAGVLNTDLVLKQTSVPLDSHNSHQQQSRIISSFVEQQQESLAQSLQSALQAAIPLETAVSLRNTVIALHFTILQDNGGVLQACTAAASLALTRAQVPMLDLVTAVQVAIVLKGNNNNNNNNDSNNDDTSNDSDHDGDHHGIYDLLVDPTRHELAGAAAGVVVGDLQIAMLPNRKLVTVWQQHSSMSTTATTTGIPPAVTTRALALCKQACTQGILPQLRTLLFSEEEQEQQ